MWYNPFGPDSRQQLLNTSITCDFYECATPIEIWKAAGTKRTVLNCINIQRQSLDGELLAVGSEKSNNNERIPRGNVVGTVDTRLCSAKAFRQKAYAVSMRGSQCDTTDLLDVLNNLRAK